MIAHEMLTQDQYVVLSVNAHSDTSHTVGHVFLSDIDTENILTMKLEAMNILTKADRGKTSIEYSGDDIQVTSEEKTLELLYIGTRFF